MKKWIFRALTPVFCTLFLNASVQAQTAAYTLHTIASGETLSALAKEYHTTVGDIMRLNGMHSNSKLKIGEKVKIPAATQSAKKPATTTTAATAAAKPVTTAASATGKEALTHTVQSGESLYRISKTYKIPLEKLMTLNHISKAGEIKVGQVLLVSDGTPPPPPSKGRTTATMPVAATAAPTTSDAQQPPVAPPTKQATVTAAPPVNSTPSLPAAPVSQSSTPVTTTSNTSAVAKPAFASNVAAPASGFFTQQFGQNVEGRSQQTKAGAAMTFKSASGWADKKFYILMNDAPPGSIVKVSNGNNAVYAKVLWSLGAQKENDGLDYRISTATAAALNITEEKFNITVTYFQ